MKGNKREIAMNEKSKKILIALQFLQVLLTTGFLGMPDGFLEWMVRLCQSIVAFGAGWMVCSTSDFRY